MKIKRTNTRRHAKRMLRAAQIEALFAAQPGQSGHVRIHAAAALFRAKEAMEKFGGVA